MQIIKAGHRYMLENTEGTDVQQIQFIDKRPVRRGSEELVTVSDGTTNEEVLKMLIDRVEYLNELASCVENGNALYHLKKSLFWLDCRTENRKARGVEGKATA